VRDEGVTEHSRDAGATRECITAKGHDRHEAERERKPLRSQAPWLGCDALRAAAAQQLTLSITVRVVGLMQLKLLIAVVTMFSSPCLLPSLRTPCPVVCTPPARRSLALSIAFVNISFEIQRHCQCMSKL
jgi:hypothetical protein